MLKCNFLALYYCPVFTKQLHQGKDFWPVGHPLAGTWVSCTTPLRKGVNVKCHPTPPIISHGNLALSTQCELNVILEVAAEPRSNRGDWISVSVWKMAGIIVVGNEYSIHTVITALNNEWKATGNMSRAQDGIVPSMMLNDCRCEEERQTFLSIWETIKAFMSAKQLIPSAVFLSEHC